MSRALMNSNTWAWSSLVWSLCWLSTIYQRCWWQCFCGWACNVKVQQLGDDIFQEGWTLRRIIIMLSWGRGGWWMYHSFSLPKWCRNLDKDVIHIKIALLEFWGFDTFEDIASPPAKLVTLDPYLLLDLNLLHRVLIVLLELIRVCIFLLKKEADIWGWISWTLIYLLKEQGSLH